MAKSSDQEETVPGIIETSLEFRKAIMEDDLNDPITLVERVYKLWWHWANFSLYVISPHIEIISPPILIFPQPIPSTEDLEHVYVIHDSGNQLSASKSQDMYTAGMSMCKLYYTIEKMIAILVERLEAGGISKEQEVQVAFQGHLLAQRKAFESIINLSYNVVVTNFDPGLWGENYLLTVKRIADKGYGYPPESPRDNYKQARTVPTTGIKR